MKSRYELTSLSTTPVRIIRDIYRKDKNGNIKSWSTTEYYSSGKVVFETEFDLPYNDEEVVIDPVACVNSYLENKISVTYSYDNTFSDCEIADIERAWAKFGSVWLLSGDHDWQVDYENIIMQGPYQVEQITDTETIPIVLSQRPKKYNWN